MTKPDTHSHTVYYFFLFPFVQIDLQNYNIWCNNLIKT